MLVADYGTYIFRIDEERLKGVFGKPGILEQLCPVFRIKLLTSEPQSPLQLALDNSPLQRASSSGIPHKK